MLRQLALALILPLSLAAQTEAPMPPAADAPVVIENDLLKVAVSPVGARLVSLVDKLRQRDEVKNLPYVGGMNEIRYGLALNLNEAADHYVLTRTTLPDGSLKIVATAAVKPTDDKPGRATVTKEYVLAPGSSYLRLALEIRNEGAEEIGLFPWVRHLINRGLKEQPEETHMTEQGAFITGRPQPGERSKNIVGDPHYFPAANWTARVVLPEEGANTMATLTRPEDMFKIYNWHRKLEDFATQELIGSPLFVAPGKTLRWEYGMVLTAPVRNIAYVAPELVIGVTPHPTWLPAGASELVLAFAPTRESAPLAVQARLVDVKQPDQVLKTFDFALTNLSPRAVSRQAIPVTLEEQHGYQLRLSFSRAGQPFFPGELTGDRTETLIPLVAGAFAKGPVVFPNRTQRDSRLRRVEPQAHAAKRVYSGEGFDAFSFPGSQRCFRPDTFVAAGEGPVQLRACAGEYESAQLVLMPKGGADVSYQVEGAALAGPQGGSVPCESVNDFLYVPVRIPSLYNALFPVGDYPEALRPVQTVTVKAPGNHPLFITYRVPEDAPPGLYRGSVILSQGAARHAIPVELTVWNIRLPKRDRRVEYACSLKGNTLAEARHADGTAYDRQEQVDAIVDMHLKYRLTPCDSGLARLLLDSTNAVFEAEMRKFVDAGATKIYLGSIPDLLKRIPEKIPLIEKYLEQKGWTDYFYVRPGFDEASSDLVPQIKAVCQAWKAISKVPIMETYYHEQRAEELFGSLDIWSRSPPVPPWLGERSAAGDRFWKVNAMPGTLEVEPWISGRKRYVGLWDIRFTGSYVWTVKAWSGVTKWGEDYWCDGGVGNLSAVLMWPHETGILSTIRLEAMRDGLEDSTMLWMLRDKVAALAGKTLSDPAQAAALAKARALCGGAPLASGIKSAADLDRLRTEAGEALSVLNTVLPANR
jgi:hypothetical protein